MPKTATANTHGQELAILEGGPANGLRLRVQDEPLRYGFDCASP
ncbi:hypothetical protein [Streptomyces endophyticus]|uniref:Uncharacterized protein n=1 Tax=Streptomyces endophyticus TaxID=714166 RepID=A0ABU6F3S8_9ACTN|nr:hypothetical protein [Streptomyces endophyticus]MEB8337561.1 hypothetical protein [Streptomyces endophyticus]